MVRAHNWCERWLFSHLNRPPAVEETYCDRTCVLLDIARTAAHMTTSEKCFHITNEKYHIEKENFHN